MLQRWSDGRDDEIARERLDDGREVGVVTRISRPGFTSFPDRPVTMPEGRGCLCPGDRAQCGRPAPCPARSRKSWDLLRVEFDIR